MAIKKLYRPFQSELFAKRAYRELRLLKHMRHENVSPKPAPDADIVHWPPFILPSPANPAPPPHHRLCFQGPGTSYLVSSQLREATNSFQEESGGRAQTPVYKFSLLFSCLVSPSVHLYLRSPGNGQGMV